MSTDLYKVSNVSWAVKSNKTEVIEPFQTIEQAAEYLESIGIPSDEIDMALVDMAGQGHTHAQFGVLKGNFIFSDNEKPEELRGVA